MSLLIQSRTPLQVLSTTYDAAGAPWAILPVQETELLAASNTNVNLITIVPTSGTAASDQTISIAGTSITNDAACTITTTRPLGGSGVGTVSGLRAFQIILSADPATTAELNAGSVASRVGALNWDVYTGGSTRVASGILAVTTEGEVDSASFVSPVSLGADTTLTLSLDFPFTTVTLQLLTAAE